MNYKAASLKVPTVVVFDGLRQDVFLVWEIRGWDLGGSKKGADDGWREGWVWDFECLDDNDNKRFLKVASPGDRPFDVNSGSVQMLQTLQSEMYLALIVLSDRTQYLRFSIIRSKGSGRRDQALCVPPIDIRVTCQSEALPLQMSGRHMA